MKFSYPFFGLFLFALLLPLTDSLAQEVDSTSVELDPVVITGTRIEQQKSKVPGSISVVTREDIEQSGHTNILPILSSQVPGLFINDRSLLGFGVGPNSGGNISIRGISGTPNTQVLVLIDGQPQFMGIFGHPIADAYTSSDIERVEVLKGAASLLYGSNALGGAINIITRQPEKAGLHGSGRLAYGSFNSVQYNGSLSYSQGKFSSFASFNQEQTDGFRDAGEDAFGITTGYLKFGYQLSQRWNVTVDGQLADAEYNQPGPTDTPTDADQRDYLRGRAAFSLENTFGKVQGALKAFYNAGEHEFTDGFRSTDLNRGFTFYQNLQLLPQNIITLGIDYKNFGGTAENDSLPPPAKIGFDQAQRVDETDLYALVEHTFFDRLILEGGIRLIQNSLYGSATTPATGIVWRVNDRTTLKASAAKAFRSPAVVDAFLFPPANEDLQPEEVWNYEVNWLQRLLNNTMSLEVSGFISRGENLIQVVPSATAGPPQRRNTGTFSNRGVELQAKYFPNQWNFMLNYAFLDVSETVLFAPRHTLGLVANYHTARWSGQAELRQVSGLNISSVPEVPDENYTLLNTRLQWRAIDWLQPFIEGNNLLNQQYQLESGYPMPGANFLGGIQVHF
ncbi:MAG: TonB-dependent receptor [Bacteroidota bacterium]